MKKLVAKADQLIRDILKLIDNKCCTCGEHFTFGNLQVGHWISRYFKGTRWFLKNNHRQCYNCNQLHEIDSEPFDMFMRSKYDIEALKIQSNEHTPTIKVQEYITNLRRIKKALENGEIRSRSEAEAMQCKSC